MLNWRKLHRRIHKWLGLSLGLLFCVIALTGSLLVFYDELDQSLNISHSKLQSNASPNFSNALNTLRKQYPDKLGSWRFEVTANAELIPARYYNPPETQHLEFAPLMVWLSRDGNTILRHDYWGQYLMTWLYNLHFTLLLGNTGTWLLGYAGLAILYLLFSGLFAWWPKRGQWQRQIKFKKRPSPIGRLYDWHKLLGLIFIIPLVILSVTGVMLALPKESTAILIKITGPIDTAEAPVNPYGTDADNTIIEPNTALSLALNTLPNSRGAWIETPATNGNPFYYRVRVQTKGDPSRRFPHSYVYIDGHTGEISEVFDYQKQGTSTTILNWLHPIHDGSFLNLTGRITWLFSGLAVGVLFILGAMRWFIRNQHKGKKAQVNIF
ncbi:PepSY domain-containing protein (plasmid) [Pseudoalteromonas sp. CF6-2]|uniref:PepSY-associated TM helix domain-containing protein n=1 Tax=Pseudoalteromonas sp. CF6-2 TaxID=562716 RepID=UPI001F49012D|nr:PepSY domain-containing protein [Pseudoalteromonas sp. CF6-2]